MRRARILGISAVAVALSGAMLAGCTGLGARVVPPLAAGPAGPGDHRVELVVDGRRRDYVLHVPPGPSGAPRPLVLELHGGGGSATNIERLTGLQAETDARDWLVVRPDGVDRQWNDGRPEVRAGIDDVAFLSTVLDDVEQRTAVDPSRVYATGISNGALMSGRLACELAGRIAAVGQVAGTQGVEMAATCAPSRPVSVLVISSTADPLVPYAGGPIGPVLGFGGGRGTVLGAEAYVAAWTERDKATLDSSEALPPDTTVSRYRGAAGTEVVFYRVDGAGHTWPGGRQYLPALLVGTTTRTFSASAVIAAFFAAH